MKLSYETAIHPARMTRQWTEDESVAYHTHMLIMVQKLGYTPEYPDPPTPNKSARVYSRKKSGMSEHITIEGSQEFFDNVRTWLLFNWQRERREAQAHEAEFHKHVPSQ